VPPKDEIREDTSVHARPVPVEVSPDDPAEQF
jgi:hypothetical protein